ncbi:hypothetical protein FHS61_001872 [Altererythrobacter atlanticus]|uniref:hypothetical protein n=1 Tax=Croceibacterium atlanticum TaxID=1267766 RepID=UPI0006B33A4C|nr:hypothetical protein [Croceibacterium atlanticum]MBB5732846.1 hypothetical protein [Croceibacterium atlanticum]
MGRGCPETGTGPAPTALPAGGANDRAASADPPESIVTQAASHMQTSAGITILPTELLDQGITARHELCEKGVPGSWPGRPFFTV